MCQKTVRKSPSPPHRHPVHPRRRRRISGVDGVKQKSYNRRPLVHFSANTGATEDFSEFSPIQIYELYLCQAVWQMMVDETNRCADQTLSAGAENQRAWRPTNVPKMMAFVALLQKRPRYSMRWSKSEVLRSPLYSATMARNRFTAILRFFTSPTTDFTKYAHY